jgi:glycosyltransferase involved in cell wall biosynthesis
MKNIGIFHYKVGGTDGVSLEIEKWQRVFEEMGHKVFLCGGDLGTAAGTLIKEMYHHLPEAKRLNVNTFIALRDFDAEGYKVELEQLTAVLEQKFRAFIQEKQIDFLIAENVWSVAAHPAVAPALAQVMADLQLPTIAHSHDFYWERTSGVALTCAAAINLADKYLPPRHPLIKHALINSLGQKELRERKGLDSVVVPNVFDFDAPPWTADSYNRDFRARIGLRENDLFILQATRIVQRKGIELAIDFVAALNSPARRAKLEREGLYDGRSFSADNRIVFVLAGYAQDDASGQYVGKLKHKIAQTGVDALLIEELIESDRLMRDGEKVYSLWDSYVYADFVTYPSLWEGWGNQLLEAIRARLPFMLFEYPVYTVDIKENGLHAISLGNTITGYDEQGLAQVRPEVIETAADEAVELLTNREQYQKTVAHNFQVGQTHYSMNALRHHLEGLMKK